MPHPRSDNPSPAALRKRAQRAREQAAILPEERHHRMLERARVVERSRAPERQHGVTIASLILTTHYTRSPTMTVPEEKAKGHAAAEIITSKPPQVSKYITIEISPPALDAMVERGFLAAGKETDDAAIRRAVCAMFNAAWMNTAPAQKDCLPAPEGVADPAAVATYEGSDHRIEVADDQASVRQDQGGP